MGWPGEALVIKMWETLTEKGIGSFLQPWHERRVEENRIELRARELRVIAQAERDAAQIRSGVKSLSDFESPKSLQVGDVTTGRQAYDVADRAAPRSSVFFLMQGASARRMTDAVRLEGNLSRALIHAEDALSNSASPAPESTVEEDWLYRWRENASNVSEEVLQALWGRLLAGEVSNPGRFSLRTLEFIRNISSAEATLIDRLAKYSIGGLLPRRRTPNGKQTLFTEELTFGDLLNLQSLGLLIGVEAVGINQAFESLVKDSFVLLMNAGKLMMAVTHVDASRKLVVPCYAITTLGQEVVGLSTQQPPDDYLEKIGQGFTSEGFAVVVAPYKVEDGLTKLIEPIRQIPASTE